jgi:Mrp family chromosome partitioning ATPase
MGLTTALLAEGIPIDNLLQKTTVPGLYVLATGPLPPNPAELLGSRHMQDILAKLKERADIVVLDSPPIMAVADAVLLIVRSEKTRWDLAKQAFNALQQVNARVIGVVFNGVSNGKDGYYNYGYYHDLPGPVASNSYARKEATASLYQTSVAQMPLEQTSQVQSFHLIKR